MSYTGRQIKITPQSIASLKENVLNEISEELFDNGDISKKYIFSIEYDHTKWNKYEKRRLEQDSNIVKGVLRVTGTSPISEEFIQYTEYYLLTFVSNYSNRDDLEIILREYQAYEATEGRVDVITISGTKYTVTKEIDGAIMPNKTDSNDGSGLDKAYFYLTDNWTFSVYILSSDDLEVSIDGNVIEYITVSHDVVKPSMASDLRNSTGFIEDFPGYPRNILNIVIPLISTEVNTLNLFMDSRNPRLINKTYRVVAKVNNVAFIDEDMELKFSAFSDTKPDILTYSLTLVTVSETQQILIKRSIDSDYTPLRFGEFRIEKVVTGINEPSVLDDDIVKTLPTTSNRSMFLSVPLRKGRIPSDIESVLEGDCLNSKPDALYDIVLTKQGVTYTYHLFISNSVIGFTENSESFLSITFSERRDV